MKKESEEKKVPQWDCFSFPCGDSCCQHGVDVFHTASVKMET
jgi:hypothetical protein